MNTNDEHEYSRIADLISKQINGDISSEEQAELDGWLLDNPTGKAVYERLSDEAQRHDALRRIGRFDEEAAWARFETTTETDNKIKTLRPSRFIRYASAAAVMAGLSFGGYLLLHKKPTPQLANNDVSPFSKQAILKTGHGKTMILDSNAKGTIAQYTNTHIQKTGNQSIAYNNSTASDTKVIFDTLQVPAGGKPYHLQLADGSNVIVNVASALRFPENFRKNDNEVELISGEAYFSIVHNSLSPLLIKARNQVIEDVGTEFNVNTYADETDSRTTLVAGAIKVNAKAILPGQQAIITADNLIIAKANIQQVVAWKDGYFRFNGEHIQAVMRELARWYNVEVVYEGKVTDVGFYLRITRSRNISEVLKVLERTNSVHFKIEGRRVTVLSKK